MNCLAVPKLPAIPKPTGLPTTLLSNLPLPTFNANWCCAQTPFPLPPIRIPMSPIAANAAIAAVIQEINDGLVKYWDALDVPCPRE